MSMETNWSEKIVQLAERLLAIIPPRSTDFDWQKFTAASWQRHGFGTGQLLQYGDISQIQMDDLLCIEAQKAALDQNTRQFLQGLPANNVLLSGAKGIGKSSLVHALMNRYKDQKLRLVQVDQRHLVYLPEIVALLSPEDYRFIIFCDDLSFEADDAGYKRLKSILEGSVFGTAANTLIYATSNRRHLLPEYASDNDDVTVTQGEIHYGEAVDEKLSLSDRFGLWLRFYPMSQDDYLAVARHWVRRLEAVHAVDAAPEGSMRTEALRWALERTTRSGRSAQHFARHWVGSRALAEK